jgi:hypothetical protein
MLTLNNVKIFAQIRGQSWDIFLQGDPADVEARFNSFWNHGASGSKMERWTDSLWSFNAFPKKILKAMEKAALFEILNTRNTKGTNPLPEARRIAKERFDSIDIVSRIRLKANVGNFYIEGSPGKSDSETTGNFDDDVITGMLNDNRGTGQ